MTTPFSEPPNPFATSFGPPAAPVPLKPTGTMPTRLDYMRAIYYTFENPNWVMNAVWAFLCHMVGQIVPILPQMVLTGYQFEIMDSLLLSGDRRYPDFDPNRITDYLTRGAWPVLAALVMALVWTPVILVFVVIAIACTAGLGAAGGDDAGPVLGLLGLAVALLLGIVLFSVMLSTFTPVVIRSGLAQSFGAGFDVGWCMDFMRRMWVDLLAATLIMTFVTFGLTILTCGLGILVLVPLAPFFWSHLWYQFYGIYLSRGGMPVVGPVPPALTMGPPGYPPKPL